MIKKKNKSKPDITKSYVRLTFMYFINNEKDAILYVKLTSCTKKEIVC